MIHIGLLEDDTNISELISLWLTEAGYKVTRYSSGKKLLSAIGKAEFDLLILDWMLPDINGDEVLRKIREKLDWHIPVIFETGRDTEEDISNILMLGADDYITKPLSKKVLLARVMAVARRANLIVADDHDTITVGDYCIDNTKKTVLRANEEIKLTQKEYELVRYLFRNIGRIVSRENILENVWGHTADINTRTADTHISRIRNKLGLVPDNGWRISSIYHHGYRLEHLQ